MRLPEIISAMGVEEMTEKGPREARKSSAFNNSITLNCITGRLQLSRLVFDLLSTSHILPITAKLHQAPFDEMLQRRRVRCQFPYCYRTDSSPQAAEKDLGMATQRVLATVRAKVMEDIRQDRRNEQDPETAILRAQKKKSNGVTASSDKKVRRTVCDNQRKLIPFSDR
jgi:hypothetical protein